MFAYSYIICIFEPSNNKKYKTMKYLAKKTNENVRAYQSIGNKGFQILCEVESQEDFYNQVARREDSDFYPQEDGRVLNGSENEVYDPEYPEMFDYRDYSYLLIDSDDLDDYNDANVISAISEFN